MTEWVWELARESVSRTLSESLSWLTDGVNEWLSWVAAWVSEGDSEWLVVNANVSINWLNVSVSEFTESQWVSEWVNEWVSERDSLWWLVPWVVEKFVGQYTDSHASNELESRSINCQSVSGEWVSQSIRLRRILRSQIQEDIRETSICWWSSTLPCHLLFLFASVAAVTEGTKEIKS
jgi:hypothetical protein